MGKNIRKIKNVMLFLLSIFIFSSGLAVSADKNVKEEGYKISITSGINGNYKYNKYFPVMVEVTSENKDIDGEVNIKVKIGSMGEYDVYSKGIIVEKGSSSKVIIPIKVSENMSFVTVDLDEGNKTLISKNTNVTKGRVMDNNLFVGLLTEDRTSLGYLSSVGISSNESYITNLTTAALEENLIGENALNIDSLDSIIVNNYNLANFNEKHYDSLNNWINKGGTLIISSGANEGKTIKNIKESFLNIKSKGYSEKKVDLFGEELNLLVSNLEIEGAEIRLESNDIPLAYKVSKGSGEVIITTFDLGLEPLISSDKGKTLIENLLAGKNVINKNNMGHGNYMYAGMELINNIPVEKVASVNTLIIVFSLYAIIVGFIVFRVLKRKNKTDYTWFIIPIIAITFTLIINILGYKTKLKDTILNQINFVQISEDGKATSTGLIGIGSKYTGDLEIKNDFNLDMSLLQEDNYYYGDENKKESILRIKTTYKDEGASFSVKGSGALDLKKFKVIGKEEIMPTLDVNISVLSGENISGKIKNNLGYDLENALIISNTSVWEVGDIKSGEEINVEGLKQMGNYGLESYGQALTQKYYDVRWKKDEDLNQEKYKNIIRKGNLFSTANYILDTKKVMLIGVTDMEVNYGINFGKKSTSKLDTTLIAQEIKINTTDAEGNVNIPFGFISPRDEYVGNNIHFDQSSGSIYGSGEIISRYKIDNNIDIASIEFKNINIYYNEDSSEKNIYNYKTEKFEPLKMIGGHVAIKDITNYINNNEVKLKTILDDTKGSGAIPSIAVKGRAK
ncbi:hypothetical protein [Clostridium sp.]|uniref:hypothetical protein n=1 Tax=Clostridium sp. TaxID=1506 RepID=UPI002635444A|nr:hypothetical protein [Clostridium sp.]